MVYLLVIIFSITLIINIVSVIISIVSMNSLISSLSIISRRTTVTAVRISYFVCIISVRTAMTSMVRVRSSIIT